MKRLALLSTALALFCPIFANGAQDGFVGIASVQVENDYGFSDRYYTQAIKFNYTASGDDWWTSFLQFKLLGLFAGGEGEQRFQSASLGQDMYVGFNINIPDPPEDDRPYAGWLYLSSGAHIATKNALDSLTVTIGIIGPQSYAEDVQKAYHEMIGADRPMGWDHQLKNEPGFIIAYNHAQRLLDYKISDEMRTDFIGALGANLGNVIVEGRAKALLRIGFNMPYNFEATRIDASSGQDVEWRGGERKDWHLYAYIGGIARFVAHDITLNGNTFAHSRSVDQEWFVMEGNAGISARYKNLEFSFNLTIRSEDFKTQRTNDQIFWSTNLKYAF